VSAGGAYVGAVYHPPKAVYKTELLLHYIEVCVEEISHNFPSTFIVLAGDFSQLPDHDVVGRTGLTQIVSQPTRGLNTLNRIYVCTPDRYISVSVVSSVVRSDHKAVVALSDMNSCVRVKKRIKRVFRQKSPAQNAMFLLYGSSLDFDSPALSSTNAQAAFDQFYDSVLGLLNQFYPLRSITITSRDPSYITPDIKTKLRRKNRLMHAGG
jgi:hypothetical protein